jgi:transposase
MEKLSQKEIDRRMIQWRNDRRLEPLRKRRMEELEQRCAELEATLERERAERRAEAETFRIRIEQLEAIVFGRKKKPDDHDDVQPPRSDKPEKKPRSSSSFRRATPKENEITERVHYALPSCSDCGHALRRRRTVTRFVEDIPLPQKIVKEQAIECGFCPQCKRTKSAIPISPQHCTLGQNVRLYILFAITVRLTFEKIKAHLNGLHALSISDGEIAAIIREGHHKLLPSMKGIEAKTREAPAAHYDETSYPVQHGTQGNYAWVKTSSIGPETIFCLGQTRGKGNAEKLRGEPSDQVGVSDDYGAYDKLFTNHALCWAHPLRKFRDLAKSGALSPEHHKQCRTFYKKFHALERSVALIIAAPLSLTERESYATRFERKMKQLMIPCPSDVSALARLKNTFLENREKYLLCIRMPNVPMTNNKAERSLRHLVIKRLLSFGSRSQQGAQAMGTILSVCLTLWWKKPEDYFKELRGLMSA